MRKRKKKLLKGTGKNTKYPRNSKEVKDAPTKMGIKRPYRKVNQWNGPFAHVDHAMVRRLLKKHVGRSWDLVWQEICAENDSRTFEGNEVREWMEFAVERNCMINDEGVVIDEHGHELGNWRDGYYVHPESGLLCHVPQRPRWRRKESEQKVFEMDGTLYHECDGVWYRVVMKELRPIERTRYTRNRKRIYILPTCDAFDLNLSSASTNWEITCVLERRYGLNPNGKYWYCDFKESANSKEIAKLKKKYNLDNQSEAA